MWEAVLKGDWTINVTTLISLTVVVVGFVTAWVKISEIRSGCWGRSRTWAPEEAVLDRLERQIEDLEVRITAGTTALQMFREEVARQYPSHSAL